MKETVRRRALALGFDDCRFAPADLPEHRSAFLAWLNKGYHGTMGYLERTAPKRTDPSLVLEGARTVICLAVNYHRLNPCNPPAGPSAASGTGVVARYARFQDYHDALSGPLAELARFVENSTNPPGRCLWYVDTGPILEREFAQRAGIGFVGKHANLVHRALGNWILLAEILTTVSLEADRAEKNRCGSCTRCLAACPTQAIVAPFELDARRCISYLTIELKGSIPVELRPAIGNRVFGCDDCLAVCPWNRFARDANTLRRFERPELASLDLLRMLQLDEPSFRQEFAGTPILRAKRRGFLRNVCVALGNIGDENAIPALQRASCDSEPLIAEHARWAIGAIQARVEA